MDLTDPANSPSMPKEIALAIVKIMAGVGVVMREGRNEADGYSFASIDTVLEKVGPLCAEAGLVIYPAEIGEEVERIEVGTGIKIVVTKRFEFILIDSMSGASWSHPKDRRSVRLVWSGAQTSGIAQSYALKQFMRGLFQIPTGERDADEFDQDQRVVAQSTPKINKARKEEGKRATSNILAFDFGRGKVAIPIDDLEDKLSEFMDSGSDWGADKRAAWRNKNQESIGALFNENRALWLKIKDFTERD